MNCNPQDIYKHKMEICLQNTVTIPRIINYSNHFDDVSWSNIYTRPFDLLIDTRTIEFQYRCVHDLLVNNYWLSKWKIADSDLCRLCKAHSENIFHMFWECNLIQTFWSDCNDFCRKCNLQLITPVDVFLGNEDCLICTVILKAKHFIYRSFVKDSSPTFHRYSCHLNYVKKIERGLCQTPTKRRAWYER